MVYLEPEEELWKEIEAIARDEELDLYDLESRPPSLRIFVERDEVGSDREEEVAGRSKGVGADDCARLLRRLLVFFSVEGGRFAVGERPELEVSSPGVNRHLRLRRHFEDAVDMRIKAVYQGEPGAGDAAPTKCCAVGLLEGVEDEKIRMREERSAEDLLIPFSNLVRANVEFRF